MFMNFIWFIYKLVIAHLFAWYQKYLPSCSTESCADSKFVRQFWELLIDKLCTIQFIGQQTLQTWDRNPAKKEEKALTEETSLISCLCKGTKKKWQWGIPPKGGKISYLH